MLAGVVATENKFLEADVLLLPALGRAAALQTAVQQQLEMVALHDTTHNA
jgi:hypothetical protein